MTRKCIKYLSKNPEDEGEWVPITLGEFYNMTPRSTDSRDYEFDSLSEATTEKDIDQIHVYESQLEMGETSGVISDEFESTDVLVSSFDDVSSLRNSNTLMDETALGLDLLVRAFDDYTVNAIEPATTLSLTYPKLID